MFLFIINLFTFIPQSWILKLTLLIDTGTGNSVDSLDDSVAGDIKCSDLADATVERSFDGLQDNESSECFKFPLQKVILLLLWPRASIRMGFGMV